MFPDVLEGTTTDVAVIALSPWSSPSVSGRISSSSGVSESVLSSVAPESAESSWLIESTVSKTRRSKRSTARRFDRLLSVRTRPLCDDGLRPPTDQPRASQTGRDRVIVSSPILAIFQRSVFLKRPLSQLIVSSSEKKSRIWSARDLSISCSGGILPPFLRQ